MYKLLDDWPPNYLFHVSNYVVTRFLNEARQRYKIRKVAGSAVLAGPYQLNVLLWPESQGNGASACPYGLAYVSRTDFDINYAAQNLFPPPNIATAMADHSSLNPAIDPSLLGITQDSAEVDISQNDEQSNRAHSASPLTPTTRNRNVTPMELIAQAHETERPPAPESTCPLPDSPTQNAWKTYINSPRTNSSREDAGPSVNSREDSNPQSGNTGGNEKGKGKASTPPAQMEEDLDIQVSDTEENVDVEVSDTEAEDIPIVLPNGERYPGDNPVTRGRMNYYFRENIDDFMERVRQNGNVDKICMMADWRTPRDKIGKYQLPHQLPCKCSVNASPEFSLNIG